MSRRDVRLTDAQEQLLRRLHAQTQPERDAAIHWYRERLASRDGISIV
jgi:hypothetical protein